MFDAFYEARQHAMQIREFYDAYIAAGFSTDQAFEMVRILVGGLSAPPR